MPDQPCRRTSTTDERGDRVRLLNGRHLRDCNTSGCPGCQPCTERHCQVCSHEHVTADGRGTDQTCATCLGRARTALTTIWERSTQLFSESLIRGINAHATTLAGPVADVEAWRHRRLSVLAGRIDPSWMTEQGKALSDDDVPHPLWVLASWEHQVRTHLDQLLSPGSSKPTLTEARDYLEHHLGWLAHDATFDFAGLASDLHGCVAHLERVLHLDEHVDQGPPCYVCGNDAVLKDYGVATIESYTCRCCGAESSATADPSHCRNPWCWTPLAPEPCYAVEPVMWHCPSCDSWWNPDDYADRAKALHVQHADELTIGDLATRTRVPAGTLRRWLYGYSWKRKDGTTVRVDRIVEPVGTTTTGAHLYRVADVAAIRDQRATREVS